MSIYAPSAVAETKSTQWRPGEELAASGFVAMSFLLVVDINIGIWHLFKRKQGLYYWSMMFALFGISVDCLGIVVKYFMPNPLHLWPLYTLCLVGGWSIYAPAQLLVLYSRLHLVNQSQRIQRWVLFMIVASLLFLIAPTWIIAWPAEDPKYSSLWSPRKGVVDRYTQLGFSVIEFIISGIYVRSLFGLLKRKSSVRQRRVMQDLVYVMVIAVCLDIIVVVLVYINQLGLSHPIQSFSYAVKLKLEFIVLNQLMAVAAKGIRKGSLAERRYHHPSVEYFPLKRDEKTTNLLLRQSQKPPVETSSTDRANPIPTRVVSRSPAPESPLRTNRAKHEEPEGQSPTRGSGFHFADRLNISGSVVQSREAANQHPFPHGAFPVTTAPRSPRYPFGSCPRNDSRDNDIPRADIIGYGPWRVRCRNNNDDDAEEIGLHMWENRGKLSREIPWFRREGEV